ncbi:unnamed protein product [Allacma fusca]|uniref:Uncharacterized protein n=1 Tax=Allacma fusca TaxID=39272 RepID=A0A8J2PQ29_9HEXA|nr:unnamed protein product [Allacma fusca]
MRRNSGGFCISELNLGFCISELNLGFYISEFSLGFYISEFSLGFIRRITIICNHGLCKPHRGFCPKNSDEGE